jgi:DNA-binding transcriptional MerR regulator
MTIGDLARRTGVAVKVPRPQQNMVLIYTRGHSPAGYRLFDENALRCVHVVRGLRDLGLTEAPIAHLAGCCDDNPALVGPPLATLLARATPASAHASTNSSGSAGVSTRPNAATTTVGATPSGPPIRGDRSHRIDRRRLTLPPVAHPSLDP